MEKLLLSPSEVANALGLGCPKVRWLISRGELPSIRIGRRVRVPVVGLRRWVEGQAAEPLVTVGPIESVPQPE
jgi:excisionase family DNA binding protein